MMTDGKGRAATLYKCVAILIGAFLMGMLWRQRGDHGFGGMWGMFAVSAGFCLYLFSVFKDKMKINYELFPITLVSMAVTVTGWGTLLEQPLGRLASAVPFAGETAVRVVEMNPLSGVLIMLCLGFGWMPLFGFMMGRFFSNKPYTLKHILTAFAVFFAAELLLKATAAHLALRLINPDAVSLFQSGLIDQGIQGSPYGVYMSHFNSDVWAKAIPGGRNYFTSIEVVSFALSALCVFLYQRFFLKDKTGGRVSLAVMGIAALGITLPDAFNIIQASGGVLWGVKFPEWLYRYGWSYWEYFTGFFIGLGLMILFVLAAKKKGGQSGAREDGFRLRGVKGLIYHGGFTLFGLWLTILRPAVVNLAGQEYTVRGARIFTDAAAYSAAIAAGADPTTVAYMPDGMFPEIPGRIITEVLLLGVCVAVAYKNLIRKKKETPVNADFGAFCAKAVFLYFCAAVTVYFFLGGAYALQPTFTPVTWLMLISAGVVAAGLIIMSHIRKKVNETN